MQNELVVCNERLRNVLKIDKRDNPNKKKLNKEEQMLKNAIKEAGYSNAYVEYEDNTVNILVSKKEANKIIEHYKNKGYKCNLIEKE